MAKRALTGDDIRDIRGIGCVIAPNRHPGRSAWRAQRPRMSTRALEPRRPRSHKPHEVPAPAYVRQDNVAGYDFTLYTDTTTLALQLVQDNVPTDAAKAIVAEYRLWIGGQLSEHTVEINLGAGRGW